MSAGETGGLDLTVETLQFVLDNFDTIAANFDEATDDQGNVVWDVPFLRNDAERRLYPDRTVLDYNDAIRQGDVVTVGEPSENDEPEGPGFDSDKEVEIDVTCETLTNGKSPIETSTDWRAFVQIIRRSILLERKFPITDPNCKYDYRWLEVDTENPLPEAEEARSHFGTEFTVRWHGFERLP